MRATSTCAGPHLPTAELVVWWEPRQSTQIRSPLDPPTRRRAAPTSLGERRRSSTTSASPAARQSRPPRSAGLGLPAATIRQRSSSTLLPPARCVERARPRPQTVPEDRCAVDRWLDPAPSRSISRTPRRAATDKRISAARAAQRGCSMVEPTFRAFVRATTFCSGGTMQGRAESPPIGPLTPGASDGLLGHRLQAQVRRSRVGRACRCQVADGAARERVGALVLHMAGMALHPAPVDVVDRIQVRKLSP